MGIQSCCLRPEEKKVEISSLDQENDNEIPQDSQQINNIDANNQLENHQINQQITSSKVGNVQEIEVNHNENEQIVQSGNIQNNNINQEAMDSPQQNYANEEQMEEQGEEEEEQVVEVHEEIEIEDVPQQGAKNEEELINPLDQLGDTVAQTTYINNQDNNNINNTQEELNRIFNAGGNEIPNSYITFNNLNHPIISTASAEGAFDLNQLSMQQSGAHAENANYYGMTSSVPAPISNEEMNQFLNNANNMNYDINNNVSEHFDLNNLNMDASNNNAQYSTYDLGIASQTVDYNNDLNSLGINANAGSGQTYEIHGGNTSSTLTFGGQGENNYQNFENAQVSNVVENSTYAIPGQSVSFNYSYTIPANSTVTQN